MSDNWESVRDQMKAEIVGKEAGDIVNHFKWNISIVSVGVTGERDA